MKVPQGYPGGKTEYKATLRALKMCLKEIKNPNEARDIEFFCEFPTRTSADKFALSAHQAGFSSLTLTEPDEDHPEYQVCAVVRIPVELDQIVRVEMRMHELADPAGGKYEGWGTLGDDP
ncbi:MAG: ribonuclease E inhibitor RraB [Phycisphaerales bacterium]